MKLKVMLLRQIVLFLGDVVCLVLGLIIALGVRYGWPLLEESIELYKIPFAIIFTFWLLSFYVGGLYNLRYTKNKRNFFALFFAVFAINAAVSVLFFYFIPSFAISPKIVLFLDLGVTAVLLVTWRLFFNSAVKLPPRKLAILGDSAEVKELIADLERNPQQGYKCVLHMARVDDPEVFKEMLKTKNIDVVVVAMDYRQSPDLQKALFSCIPLHIQFFDFVDFYEGYFQKIPLAAIDRAWFLENLNEPGKQFYSSLKRAVDIMLAVLLGLIGLVLSPFIILAIWIDMGFPVFFSQSRVAQLGANYRIYKFRTFGREGDDASVSVIGKLLRRTHLDEIPQLWNILKGDMSFVGPRPEQTHFVESLKEKIPFYTERLLVRPGITGWAQLHEPHARVEDAISKLQYDLFYIKHRSLLLDIEIILKTLRILLL